MTQTLTQHKIKNVFIWFDLIRYFQNKTFNFIKWNGIHLHISNELSIPNYNIQNLWNGNTDHKATKNLEANTNTCNFVFTFFLQMDLMLGGQMYFHKISRETWYSPPVTCPSTCLGWRLVSTSPRSWKSQPIFSVYRLDFAEH